VLFPTLQSTLNYFVLAIVYGSVLLLRKERPAAPVWKYAVLGLIDVEANYCLVKAYEYTSITSVTLLDCFSIPGGSRFCSFLAGPCRIVPSARATYLFVLVEMSSVLRGNDRSSCSKPFNSMPRLCAPGALVLSWLFLHASYKPRHILGTALVVSGMAFLIWTDVFQSDAAGGTDESSNSLLGDGLVLLGATLYSVSNTFQEGLLGARALGPNPLSSDAARSLGVQQRFLRV
jgi:solute carrier family 35, member F1/2